jgi:hypothetical protein
MCVSLSIYVYLRSLLRRGVLASDVVGQPPAKRRRVEEEWRRGWCQLDDGNVWKQFGDHWRKQNVDTLRDSASITFAYEERGEENRMYRLPLVPATNNKIIVRDCYKTFYDDILKLKDGKDNGLVLIGQPGTDASSSRLLVTLP